MDEVPRDPSHYTASTHSMQRMKYRKNPELSWELVTDVIQTGDVEEAKHNRVRYKKWVEISEGDGKFPHYVKVVAHPGNGVIQTQFCDCHGDGKPCAALYD